MKVPLDQVGSVRQSTPHRNTSMKPRENALNVYLPNMANLQAPPKPLMIVWRRGEAEGRKAMQMQGTKLRTKQALMRGHMWDLGGCEV